MVVKLQILKAADEKPPAAGAVVAFENNIIGTLFRDVSLITENQTKVEGENQNYAYKVYLYTLLNASKSAKAYQLANCGWMRDDGGMYDATEVKEVKAVDGKITTPWSGNTGFVNRMKWTDGGQCVSLEVQCFWIHGYKSNTFWMVQILHLHSNLMTPNFVCMLQWILMNTRLTCWKPHCG